MFNIDKSKIKPDMIIHTPTFEQAETICKFISATKFRSFSDYGKDTCINTNNGTKWSYGSTQYYQKKGLIITPFKDILVKSPVTTDWLTTLTTTHCCVKIENLEQLEKLASLIGASYSSEWLTKHTPLMVYVEKHTSINLVYSDLSYANEYKYIVYKFSDIFPSQPQEPSMAKYKVGDTFKNSKGNICTITKKFSDDTYQYLAEVDGKSYYTTEYNINRLWTNYSVTAKPTYKVGDRVKVRSDLAFETRYYMSDNNTHDSVTISMRMLAGKTVTITELDSKKWHIAEHSGWWTDEMFDGLATDTPSQIPLYLDREPQAGDYVHRDIVKLDRPIFGTASNLRSFHVVKTTPKTIYLKGHSINSDYWDINYFKVINPNHSDHPNYAAKTANSLSTTPVAIATTATANHKPNLKDKPMAKPTLKDTISTQITEVKGAAVNAAELKAGQLINKQAIKLIKPQLPMMVRGFADHPAASVVLANVIGLALKQYAPENPKLAKVSNLMLNAAAFDTIDSFNIDEMVDKLVSGIKLPAGVSIDE